METNKYIIYKITNKLTNKSYVGKHITKNINDKYMGSGQVLKQSYKKHGINNFIKEVIEECENEEIMNKREIFWISELNTFSPNGYNINTGGKGGDNFTHNPNKEQIRLKMIESKRNNPQLCSEETRKKMSESRKGKPISPTYPVTCPHCNKTGDKRNMVRWHFDNCLLNSSNENKKRSFEKRQCPYCLKFHTPQILSQSHFDFCKENPNRIFKDYSYKKNSPESLKKSYETRLKNNNLKMSEETKEKIKLTLTGIKRSESFIEKQRNNFTERWEHMNEITCPYCNLTSKNLGNMNRWHFNNCKKKPQE
jgi:group I intron endonuclease